LFTNQLPVYFWEKWGQIYFKVDLPVILLLNRWSGSAAENVERLSQRIE